MENKSPQEKPGPIWQAEAVFGAAVLALAFDALFVDLKVESMDGPLLLVRFGLFIVLIWIAHSFTSWEYLLTQVGAGQLPFGAVPHLWANLFFVGLVYVACTNHANYKSVLICLTLIALFDLIESGVEWSFSENRRIRELDRNRAIKDIRLFAPVLILSWVLYFLLGNFEREAPTIWEGMVFFLGIISSYIYDLWKNSAFYRTDEFWRAFKKARRRIRWGIARCGR